MQVTMYSGSEVKVYVSPRVAEALREVSEDLNLYKGVRLSQVLEAVYNQGKKDGARSAFTAVTEGMDEARRLIPHRPPGRPRKN